MPKTTKKPAPKTRTPKAAKRVTKQDQIVALLRRQNGASVPEMARATNWQPHSVRGFLSGTLKKKLGIEVVSERDAEGVRRYSVAPLKSDKE